MDAITVNISKQTMGFSSASWMILVSLKFIFFFHFVLSVILNAFLSVCWSWLSVLLWQQEALCSLDLSQVDFTLGWEGGQVAFSWVTPKCHYLYVFSLGSVSVSILLGNYKLGCQYSIRWKNPWAGLTLGTQPLFLPKGWRPFPATHGDNWLVQAFGCSPPSCPCCPIIWTITWRIAVRQPPSPVSPDFRYRALSPVRAMLSRLVYALVSLRKLRAFQRLLTFRDSQGFSFFMFFRVDVDF